MTPRMALLPALGMNALMTVANFEEPDVQLTHAQDEAPSVLLEEGGVVVVLAFSDREALSRFLRRLSVLALPRGER